MNKKIDWSKITENDINKININKQDANGCTPMHYLAAENHNINVIRLAYDKVKNNLIDNQGRTPFDHAIISRNINAISVLESQAKSTLKPEEYYRIEIDQNAKIKVSKNLAFDNKEIKLKDYAERFSSHSKANNFIKKQKVNTPKLANMSIVEIDAYLRNSQQKVDNTSNSKKSASQALSKRRSKENNQAKTR